MPAAIATDGARDLFASHREPAWHGLGTVFDHEVTSYEEMLDLAGLRGWDVHEIPAEVEGARFVTPTKHIAATIGGETVILGTTGDRYEIVQNEDAFAFLQSLNDGASWETAGAIKEGRVIFGSIALDREIVLDPNGVSDVVKSYILMKTSHDGSGSVEGGRTGVRVVCQNTLNLALSGIAGIKAVGQTFKFRHTMTVEQRMKAAAEEWRNHNLYFDAFEKEAHALFEQKVTNDQFFNLVEDLFPKPEKDVKGAVKKWENRLGLFAQAWNGSPNEGIRGTGWGALNALTEANQWGRNVQTGRENGQENFYAAGAGFDIPTNQFRNLAFARVKALA